MEWGERVSSGTQKSGPRKCCSGLWKSIKMRTFLSSHGEVQFQVAFPQNTGGETGFFCAVPWSLGKYGRGTIKA